jgi:hypothetical protein
MRLWLEISCLAVALALAGCMATQPYQQIDAFDQKRWDNMMVPEPSAESTNWGLWLDMQGG